MTSGTTQGRNQRGRHFMANLEHYRASAISHLGADALSGPAPAVDAGPASHCRPHAGVIAEPDDKLVYRRLRRRAATAVVRRRSGSTREAALEFLRAAESAGEAVCILGTTAALSTLFEYLEASRARWLSSASGSRLMDTGGAKGQAKPLAPGEVVEMAQRYLGIAPALVINEYGMTELSSQLYDATSFNCPDLSSAEGRVKVAPPWLW